MFCPKCGKELADGSKFCSGCGNLQRVGKRSEEEYLQEKEKNLGLKTLLIVLVTLFLVVLIGTGILLVMRVQKTGSNEKAAVMADDRDSDGQKTDYAVATDENVIMENTATMVRKESLEDIAARGSLYVGVPAESMYMRTDPGLGSDVIEEYGVGTLFEYSGITEVVEDKEFYQVTEPSSGRKGFVAAAYCTPVSFIYDDAALTIVDDSKALYDYDEMVSDLEELCDQYGEIFSYSSAGLSVDGRDIYKVILGNPNASTWIMVQAGIHGREYMSTQLVMKMIEYYVYYYYNGGSYHGFSYKDLLDNTAFVIVPMSNPDGVSISQYGESGLSDPERAILLRECYERDKETMIWELDANGDFNWADYYQDEGFDRSTASNPTMISYEEYLTLWKANANGVDLNSNFDAGWEEITRKPLESYTSYKGPYAISEPESQILCNIALEKDYKYYISYHAKGQLIYYDAKGNLPETSQKSLDLANTIYEVNKYTPVNTQEGYNVVLGGFGDWVQLSLNKSSVTVEMGKHPCPLGSEEFLNIFIRNREVWAKLCSI